MSDFSFGPKNAQGLSVGLRFLPLTSGGFIRYEFAIKNDGTTTAEVVVFKDTEAMYRTRLVAIAPDGKRTPFGAVKPENATLMGRAITVKVAAGAMHTQSGTIVTLKEIGEARRFVLEVGELVSAEVSL